jgi:DNA-binding response OmpR family regulator
MRKDNSMAARVLVVDDEMDTLSLLRTILKLSGFEAITTLNSIDAIDLAVAEQPDVVLLDIMMPKLDGFTLCKMMRQNDATRTLPIIFVTAYEALDIEDRRREAGANLVIQKPISVDLLIRSIGEMLALRAPAPANGGQSAAGQPAESPAEPPAPATPPSTDAPEPPAKDSSPDAPGQSA